MNRIYEHIEIWQYAVRRIAHHKKFDMLNAPLSAINQFPKLFLPHLSLHFAISSSYSEPKRPKQSDLLLKMHKLDSPTAYAA